MGEFFAWGLPIALAVLLVSAGIEDVRKREIANWKNAAIALMAPLWWVAIGLPVWPGMAIQLGIALLVFGLFAAAFAAGMMGGGDVKMIAALALWFPLHSLLWLLVVMSLVGGALTLVMLIDHRRRKNAGQPEIPYGVAIACAALLTLGEPLFNHFG
ncbi:A24 family peptidase [Sphingomonas qomolangmaensis]|uniref:Prepilin peptidase n=1 Tax=Sphingomonas qomolangmaensis TaxID=2918765 RepID=A0ABY5L708_9SPHN|nr:prepilin peptidase [Sphingomonas qomolangmaensis]UUL81393.1 prepilin peptidase [Sphingomonas qomolangmaensis]